MSGDAAGRLRAAAAVVAETHKAYEAANQDVPGWSVVMTDFDNAALGYAPALAAAVLVLLEHRDYGTSTYDCPCPLCAKLAAAAAALLPDDAP